MAEITAIVSQGEELLVTTQQNNLTNVYTNLNPPAVVERLGDIGNVDVVTNGEVNGSVLVYKTNTNKWTSTRTLDLQIMEGGEF
jgi:hypothetical protein